MSVDSVEGCYELKAERTFDVPEGTMQEIVRFLAVPKVVRLDTQQVERINTAGLSRIGEALDPATRLEYVREIGWRIENGTLHVFWSGGYVGTHVDLEARGDSLVGTAESWGDAGAEDDTVAVVAKRVACPR